jgi:hypothetical protein
VSDGRVLRVFRFQPVRKGFDATLRDVLVPDLLAMADVVEVYVGRQGPEEMGERLVASIWASRSAMASAVGEDFDHPVFHPEHLAETTERVLEIHELDITLRFHDAEARSQPATGILRLVRGQVRPGELATYRDEVRVGTVADVEHGHGPLALYLAVEPPDRFVTLSVWSSWAALEAATGGNISRPIATRHEERIEAWEAVHYEILPNMAHPAARVARS